MGAMPNEPSMEEILSSIKRIIAEEDGLSASPRAPRRSAAASSASAASHSAADDQILELTDAFSDESEGLRSSVPLGEAVLSPPSKTDRIAEAKAPKVEAVKAEKSPSRPRAAPAPASPAAAETLVSDDSARAARDSLVNLSRLLISPDDGQPNTLDGLVREMLRPMLKEWLDTNLPPMVETMVKREIDRITGRV
jgi:cell pole-organizing protein PopZ